MKFEKSSIDFVDDDDGFDTFSKRLTQDCFSLNTDALNAIDDDESTVSDTKCRSDFG